MQGFHGRSVQAVAEAMICNESRTWDVGNVGLDGHTVESGQVCSPLKDAAVWHDCGAIVRGRQPRRDLPGSNSRRVSGRGGAVFSWQVAGLLCLLWSAGLCFLEFAKWKVQQDMSHVRHTDAKPSAVSCWFDGSMPIHH
jgi:hypothetical protein